jgi:diguanylate cyclase (GGDEF)-like protein
MATAPPTGTGSSLGERYRVLLEIGRTLTGTLSLDDLYRAIYRETAGVLEASGFYISLYHAKTDLARVVYYADKGEESRCDITYRGTDSEVIRTGLSTTVDDRLETRSVMLLGDEDSEVTRSAISSPLIYEGEVIGAISTQSYSAHAYTPEDVELLEGIADLAAIAVENARRINELDRRRREAEQIEEIGRALTSSLDFDEVLSKVTASALDLMDADGATVWMIENRIATCRASTGSVEVPIGATWDTTGAIYDRLAGDRSAFIIEELGASPMVPDGLRAVIEGGTGIAVPLLVSDEVAGALAVGSKQVRAFSDDDVRVLTHLAGQASIALDNARLHQDLQALSMTDPLTGLPNRRHLEVHLEREVAAARRGRSLCMLIFDLDDFKRYNDTLGHIVGDEILRCFSGVLNAENRAMNLVARFGGDEFVSVLSDTDETGAVAYLQRVRARLKTDPVLAAHEVSVSSGFATFDPEKMDSPDDLFKLADRQMYLEKEARR